jgi:hypothetical protein
MIVAVGFMIAVFVLYMVLKSWTDGDDKGSGTLIGVLVALAVIAVWVFENGGADVLIDEFNEQQRMSTSTTSPWVGDP